METPVKDSRRDVRRRFTLEEKKQLLANLDIEVAHRTRQFEESLAHILENFKNHHEGQVLRVPKLVRNITMGEFADKYNGDINECLRGLQREKQGGEPTLDSGLKRKWKDSEDVPGPDDAESCRASKTARIASPVKMNTAKILKARLNKTPGTLRAIRHPHPSFGLMSPTKIRPVSRTISPSKASSSRLPSTKDFNPLLPKTPAFPRAPRKNESLMSINGSPLAIPSKGGLIPSTIDEGEDENEHPTLRRTKSIVIRRDPSFSFPASQQLPGLQSRAPSQTSQHSSQSRSQSPNHLAHSSSGSSSSIPSSSDTVAVSQPSAFMRVPTKDGLILEFDPLLTAPEELDTLEGITDSAKKQAREDMTRLVQAALARWKI
ncbi:hypothetical protein EW145_g5467 [Phellinidium pouzarii]|uniref:Uncharacterized protein n=1 Tax=Phellinidium pouzarii TaxID=167371 RepID=A0A4S4KZV7_9AGAM|nr:hypothetical protein EW145_g5467 [Phellinidium pouzarii]